MSRYLRKRDSKPFLEYYVAVGPGSTFNDLLFYQRIYKLYLKRSRRSSSNFTSSKREACVRSLDNPRQDYLGDESFPNYGT